MRQAVLLGNRDTKRTVYLSRAAAQEGLPLRFVDWSGVQDWMACPPGGEIFLKIDPPLWESASLDELDDLTQKYAGQLAAIAQMGETCGVRFFNRPSAIGELLDKRTCKERLLSAGLPVTELLSAEVTDEEKLSVEGLLERMQKQRVHQIFIKPVKGSGAAGVSAFRWQPLTGRMALYTCALETADGGLVNTKRLRRFAEPEEIFLLLERILSLGCIVERWYAKTAYQGLSYDLRAVVQDNEVDFILARLSKGPITNLHLNNHPLKADALGLPGLVLESAADLCKRAVGCFPGLRSAGIDLLLEKGSRKPRIIEMNAQGDLIYQDIFHENVIYRHQARMMRKWLTQEGGCEG